MWFQTNRSEHGCSYRALRLAAASGHLDVDRWLCENRSEEWTNGAVSSAASNGHLVVVRFLLENCSEARLIHAYAWSPAAWAGHLEMVKYLCSIKPARPIVEALSNAASGGHSDVVNWLVERARETGESLKPRANYTPIDSAAFNGHFEVVKYLFASLRRDEAVFSITSAALGGRLDMMRWIVETQPANDEEKDVHAPWRSYHAARTRSQVSPALKNLTQVICSAVLAQASLELIRYLYEQLQAKRAGLDPSTATYFHDELVHAVRSAAHAGRLDVVQFLIRGEFRADPSKALLQALHAAGRSGHLPVVRWV
jgi:hypothetical protein